MNIKLGVMFANILTWGQPEYAAALGEACDACGIESLWTVEHVVLPAGFTSEYPYSKDGKMPGGEDSSLPDPLIWLAYVAAHSRDVKLATGILILPQRNPVVLAKEVATLDVLSKGRVVLGVGVGWLREEFEAIGVPFEGRGRRTDDYIGAMRALWTEPEPTFHSSTVNFDRAKQAPKPVQQPVPIVIGGHTESAARRAGRLGDGFFPARPDRLGELLPILRAAATEAGRDPATVEVTTGGAPQAAFAQMLEDQGVARLVVPPPAFTPDDLRPAFERIQNDLSGS